jgi:membrane protease YdiL (CAAX protease family)
MTGWILRALAVFLGWYLAISLAISLLPPLGALLVLVPFALWYVDALIVRGHDPSQRRRWAMLRLRPLRGEALRWTLVGIPVFAALSWSMGQVYVQLVPVPPEVLNPFEFLTDRPDGRLALTVFAVAFAPIVEELVFRGLLQRPLERRWGAGIGIALAAFAFAAIHLLPWVMPLHFALGLLFGAAVYAARSIWAGVILHAANNSLAVLGFQAAAEYDPIQTVWQSGVTLQFTAALAVLALSAAATLAVGRRLWAAARQSGVVSRES